MRVIETPELARKPLTKSLDMRGTCHRQTESALGAHREPVIFLIAQTAIGVALLVGQRSEHEPVRHCRTAHERHGVEWRGGCGTHSVIVPAT